MSESNVGRIGADSVICPISECFLSLRRRDICPDICPEAARLGVDEVLFSAIVNSRKIQTGAAQAEAAGRLFSGLPGLRLLQAFAPWVVLGLGLGATAWMTVATQREMTTRDAERFHHETEQLVWGIEARLRTYAQGLMGLRDRYIGAQTNMTEEIWQGFISTLHIPFHYPGLYDVGFVESVFDLNAPNTYPAREDHLRRMRDRLGPEYRFQLPPGGIEGAAWYSFPVTWHSYAQWRRDPVKTYPHYGMDLNQNQDLWAAMNWALGEDRLAFSGKQILDPDQSAVIGLLLFAPVYRHSSLTRPDLSPTFRHIGQLNRLRGLVFGGIDMAAFLAHHLGTNQPTVTFALYASTNQTADVGPQHLLFDNRVRAHGLASDRAGEVWGDLRQTRELPLYGRTLSFIFELGPVFVSVLNKRSLWFAASFGVATTLLLAGFIDYQARANRKERRTSEALRESEGQLQALIREREQSDRDLHDGVLQSLYALGLGLQKSRKVLQRDPKRAEDYCRQNVESLELVMGELRRHLGQGSRPPLQDLDPVAALEAMVGTSDRNGTVPVILEMEAEALRTVSREQAFQLLQIVREAMANAERHSRASRIVVRLKRVSETLEMCVEDDGVGFDIANPNIEGYGLRNMASRIEDLGGEFALDSRHGSGTRVVVRMPVAPNSDGRAMG